MLIFVLTVNAHQPQWRYNSPDVMTVMNIIIDVSTVEDNFLEKMSMFFYEKVQDEKVHCFKLQSFHNDLFCSPDSIKCMPVFVLGGFIYITLIFAYYFTLMTTFYYFVYENFLKQELRTMIEKLNSNIGAYLKP